jgi:hypothetical protein
VAHKEEALEMTNKVRFRFMCADLVRGVPLIGKNFSG